MSYQQLTAGAAWPDTPQYTAASEMDVEIINPRPETVKWITTPDDTKPTLPETDASPIGPGQSRAITLAAGERLWLAVPGYATGTAQITLQF